MVRVVMAGRVMVRGRKLVGLLGRVGVGSWGRHTRGERLLEKLEALGDLGVCRRQLGGASIGVDSVRDLGARFIQCSQVVPHLGHLWVDPDGPRVGVHGVTVLLHLIVQDANGAPECGVSVVAVHGLLVGLIGEAKILLRHVDTSE